MRKTVAALTAILSICSAVRAAVGDVDLSFNSGSGIDYTVERAIVQPDGKILIQGWFQRVNGLQRRWVARLLPDGRGDSTFLSTNDSGWSAMILQPDGKVILAAEKMIRLHPNGSNDTTFSGRVDPVSPEFGATVYDLALQPDGKLVAAGHFATPIGNDNNYGVARFHTNGALDVSFDVPPEVSWSGFVKVQSDGKILVSGGVVTQNGLISRLYRLNPNGTFDTNYPSRDIDVYGLILQPDGKLLIAGAFFQIDGQERQGIARLNVNGTLDPTFDPGTNIYSPVGTIALQSDGKVVLNNDSGILRLNANGTRDLTFTNPGYVVSTVVSQPDHKTVVLGRYIFDREHIGRLNANGTLDTSFDAGHDIGVVRGISVQPDGRILVGNPTPFISGTNRLAGKRLNPDGSIDPSFTPSIADLLTPLFPEGGYAFTFSPIAVQPDGKILTGGNAFRLICNDIECYGEGYNFLARVNSDLTRDTNFPINTNIAVSALALQPDGKLVVAGWHPDGNTNRTVFRLHANGALDTSFASVVVGPPIAVSTHVRAVALQADGKVLIGGLFNSVNGTARNGIARLNANGTLDTSFNPGTGVTNSYVYAIAVQPDGKILIGGSFTNVNGTTRHRIARLNTNGTLDTVFHPGAGADNSVYAIAVQPDGQVVIGGDFITAGGAVRPYMARLFGDSSLPALTQARSNNALRISWPVTALNLQLHQSANVGEAALWSAVAEPATTAGGTISVNVPANGAQRFFQLATP